MTLLRWRPYFSVASMIVLSLVACSTEPPEPSPEYSKHLSQAKANYPFEVWKTYSPDMEQYTIENCDAAARIFDTLLAGLAAEGADATERTKLKHFRKAVLALNDLNDSTYIIETGEREELAALIDEITVLAGLTPADYAGGAGVADLWRGW